MVFINEHYLKLTAGYLFPEIDRRVQAFAQTNPDLARRIIRCGIGDVTEPLPQAVREAMHKAVDDLGERESFKGYGPPFGYDFIRETIAKCDFQDHGIDISPDEVFLSDGSKGDCGAVLDILASPANEQRNTIGITDPVYPVYVDTNVMVGNTGPARDGGGYDGIVYMPCTADNSFVPDIPKLPLDVIYLCYPNNPTGSMITREQLSGWVRYALANNALILYDVAYQAFIRDPDLPRSIYEIRGAERCAMEFHSFSKNGGFTGVRCGYTICPRELKGRTATGDEVSMHRLWSRRWSTKSNGVSYVVQRAAEALYSEDGREQVRALTDYYLGNAAVLREGCEAMGLDVYGGINAPYVWVRCPDRVDSWQMFDRMLEQANVVVTPGAGFGRCGEGYFRISAFNSRDNVEEVVTRMKALAGQSVGA